MQDIGILRYGGTVIDRNRTYIDRTVCNIVDRDCNRILVYFRAEIGGNREVLDNTPVKGYSRPSRETERVLCGRLVGSSGNAERTYMEYVVLDANLRTPLDKNIGQIDRPPFRIVDGNRNRVVGEVVVINDGILVGIAVKLILCDITARVYDCRGGMVCRAETERLLSEGRNVPFGSLEYDYSNHGAVFERPLPYALHTGSDIDVSKRGAVLERLVSNGCNK